NTDNGCADTLQFAITDNVGTAPAIDIATPEVDYDVDSVTSCNTNNGSIEILEIDGSTDLSGYYFLWYSGADTTTGSFIGGNAEVDSTALIANQAAGQYTVIAIDSTSGCSSAQATFQIDEVPEEYTATMDASSSNNTVCNLAQTSSGRYNGELVVDPDLGTPADYTYAWYQGTDTTGNILPAAQAGSGVSTDANFFRLDSIPGGTYQLLLTSNTTGCSSLLSFSIADSAATPEVQQTNAAIDTTDVTVCIDHDDYPNGAITLIGSELVPTGGSFTINWYYGASVNAAYLIEDGDDMGALRGVGAYGTTVNLSDSLQLINVDPGDYTVQIIDLNTGCPSAEITIPVADDTPTLTATANTVQDQFSCDLSTPTGKVGATIAGGTGPYTYEWFQGVNTIDPTNLISTVQTSATFNTDEDTVSVLESGIYTVKITDDATGCFATDTVQIIESTPSFAFTLDQTPQTMCDPDNGSASLNALTINFSNGTPRGFSDVADTTYQWYEGQGTSNPIAGETGDTLINRLSGWYTLVISESASGCVSSIESIEIQDNISSLAPTVSWNVDALPNGCDGQGGGITATVTGGSTYTYFWYEGTGAYDDLNNDLDSSSVLVDSARLAYYPGGFGIDTSVTATTASIANVITGYYTIVSIDQNTGCRYQESYYLPYNGIQATTTLTIKHVEACPDDGEANVSLADNITFTFTPGDFTGDFDVLDTIRSGDNDSYAVVNDTTDGAFQASMISGDFQDNDEIINTSQTGNIASGKVTISNEGNGTTGSDVDNVGNYIIYLYSGDGVPADRTSPYSVYNSEGDDLRFPYTYDAANGEIHNGDGTLIDGTADVLVGDDTATFNFLPSGVYTAVAQEVAGLSGNSCWTLAATDSVHQKAFDPLLDSSYITNNTACDEDFYNGNLYAKALRTSDDTTTTGFNFHWYVIETSPTDTVFERTETVDKTVKAQGADIETFESSFSDTDTLAPGDYVLVIETIYKNGGGNGCTADTIGFTVQNQEEDHNLFNATITDLTDCSPSDQGIIAVDDNSFLTGNIADYEFAFYSAYPPGASDTIQTFSTDSSLEAQTPGTYFVQALHLASGCYTDALEVEIDSITTLPVVAVSLGNIDSSCVVSDDIGLGQIEFSIENTTATDGDYFYQWYAGTDTTTGNEVTGGGINNISGTQNIVAGATLPLTLENVDGGQYTLLVMDKSKPDSTCAVISTFNLIEDTQVISVDIAQGDAVTEDNVNCDVSDPTGTIVINSIRLDGDPYAIDGTYTITWPAYVSAAGTIDTKGGTAGDSVYGLPAGTYKAWITNSITSCETTDSLVFTIADDTSNPVIGLASRTDDVSCDEAVDT
ncbi:MAG: hypothetical protein JXQ90_24090, partial [Cyclobacteriaceae bacterium]